MKANFDEFTPNGGVWANEVTDAGAPKPAPSSPGMSYTIPLPANTPHTTTEFQRHIVLLRRLANPYAPAGATNPYITVDLMDYVPSFDAIMELKGAVAKRASGAGGYDAYTSRFSVGKVQPYAGHAFAAPVAGTPPAANLYTFPNSMVLAQKVTDTANNSILDTFGTHNGATGTQPAGQTYVPGPPPSLSDTLMTPFDWLPHMDRTLVNQIELFQVRDAAPHRLTDTFVLNTQSINAAAQPGVTYDAAYAAWADTGLARGLEYLTVKPYTAGVPLGGRAAGKINVNALPDQRVLLGLTDPATPTRENGNVFDTNYVQTTLWSNWLASRTPLPAQPVYLADGVTPVNRTGPPNQTFAEANSFGGAGVVVDRPFLPFGAPVVIGGSPFAYGSGGNADNNATLPSNADLTILRRFQTGGGMQPVVTTGNPPMLSALPGPPGPINNTYGLPPGKTTGTIPAYPTSHPNAPSYFRNEPARKILNNVTTVNHQFLVFLTIGYFEADTQNPVFLAPGVPVPQLGPEAFLNVPGDMRQKVVAVIDMSNMSMDPVSNLLASRPAGYSGQVWQPFFTSLEATAYANSTSPTTATLSIAYSRYDSTATNPVLYVAADGQEVAITGPTATAAGTNLVIGYGTEQQVVQVTGVSTNMAGQPILTVQTVAPANGTQPPFRTAWAGTCVSNVRPGYPGDATRLNVLGQPFDYNAEAFKPIVPYFERLK
jgi:hypothetical protein